MTQKPPPRLPDPGLVLRDGTVLPGAAAVEAWHLAWIEHCRQVRIEAARYAAVCAGIRETFGPPAGTAERPASRVTWHQADFDSTADTDDQAVFSAPDGTWFAADAGAYLPPCEMEG